MGTLPNSVGALIESQNTKTGKPVFPDLRPNRIWKTGNMGTLGILRSRLICRYLCHFCKSNSLAAKEVNANLIYLTTEGGSLFEGSSGKEELSCSIPGGVALIRSVFGKEVAFIFGIFQ